MAKRYNVRVSTFFDITDEYTAFCLDEACAYIYSELEQGHEPHYKVKAKSFSDFYKQFE